VTNQHSPATTILTLLFLVPINSRMMRLDSNPAPATALRERNLWDTLHRGGLLRSGRR